MRVPGFSDRLAMGLAYLTIRADPLLATERAGENGLGTGMDGLGTGWGQA